MLFDILTLVLGIFLTIRKLEVRRHEAASFPEVDGAAFELWKSTALRAYNLGAIGCFAKLVLDYAVRYGLSRVAPWKAVQVTGFLLFVAWIGVLIGTLVFARRARMLQQKAGIRLVQAPQAR